MLADARPRQPCSRASPVRRQVDFADRLYDALRWLGRVPGPSRCPNDQREYSVALDDPPPGLEEFHGVLLREHVGRVRDGLVDSRALPPVAGSGCGSCHLHRCTCWRGDRGADCEQRGERGAAAVQELHQPEQAVPAWRWERDSPATGRVTNASETSDAARPSTTWRSVVHHRNERPREQRGRGDTPSGRTVMRILAPRLGSVRKCCRAGDFYETVPLAQAEGELTTRSEPAWRVDRTRQTDGVTP